MVRVIARKPHTYNAVPRLVGDIYEAYERDVFLLQAFGNAEIAPVAAPEAEAPPAPVSSEKKGRYRRRDMRAL